MLLMQAIACALLFALASAGRSNPARMAMMAMTTSSSMSVKARRTRESQFDFRFVARMRKLLLLRIDFIRTYGDCNRNATDLRLQPRILFRPPAAAPKLKEGGTEVPLRWETKEAGAPWHCGLSRLRFPGCSVPTDFPVALCPFQP